MQTGQVPVWVPIVVGVLGVVGVLLGQLLSTWREHRNDVLRARRELEQEQRRVRREDDVHWREHRTAIGVDFLITLNAWRELEVDAWKETARNGEVSGGTREELSRCTIRLSDQLAHVRLVGTRGMASTASDVVSRVLAMSREIRDAVGAPPPDQPDLRAASARLSADVRRVREVFRLELRVPDGDDAVAGS